MKRSGKIIHLTSELGIGEIVDDNEQEILFDFTDLAGPISLGEEVMFKIRMKKCGLRATKITPTAPRKD